STAAWFTAAPTARALARPPTRSSRAKFSSPSSPCSASRPSARTTSAGRPLCSRESSQCDGCSRDLQLQMRAVEGNLPRTEKRRFLHKSTCLIELSAALPFLRLTLIVYISICICPLDGSRGEPWTLRNKL